MKQKRQNSVKGTKYYILLNILVLLTAVNTGLNLLFFISVVMFLLLVFSLVMGKNNIEALRIKREIKSQIFEGEQVKLLYKIQADKPKMFLEIKENYPFVKSENKLIFISYVDRKNTIKEKVKLSFLMPGVFQLSKIKIISSFPFPFLEFSKYYYITNEITVYPKTFDFTCFPENLMEIKSESEQFKSRIGFGDDIWGIKPYEFGDRIRDIDWRLSLKNDDILVKVREKKLGKKIWIVPFISGEKYTEKNANILRMAGSIALNRLKNDYAIGLLVGKNLVVPQTGKENIYLILKNLANIWNEEFKNIDYTQYTANFIKKSIVFIITNESPEKYLHIIKDFNKYGNKVIVIIVNKNLKKQIKNLLKMSIEHRFELFISEEQYMEMVFEK